LGIIKTSDVLEAGSAKIATTVSVSKTVYGHFGSHTLNIAEPVQESRGRQTVKAKFHYAIPVADRSDVIIIIIKCIYKAHFRC